MNDPMKSGTDPLLLDHEYDGIQELDNNLPLWWVWLFYLCILFAGLYLGYYHVLGMGKLQLAEYDAEMTVGNAIKQQAQTKFEAELGKIEPSKDQAVLGRGRNTYITYCAPCHREDGGGLVGPNLCDDYWIHGPSFADNMKVILNGIPDKGMLTWRGVLPPSDLIAVASYIYTMRGSNPPNPKMREDLAPKPTEVYE